MGFIFKVEIEWMDGKTGILDDIMAMNIRDSSASFLKMPLKNMPDQFKEMYTISMFNVRLVKTEIVSITPDVYQNPTPFQAPPKVRKLDEDEDEEDEHTH